MDETQAHDLQGERFQVFTQEKLGTPHRDAGTVHAFDAELALFNARDVFVRRPSCVSLWIVPVTDITFITAEQLAAGDRLSERERGPQETFHVFAKERAAGALSWVTTLEAASPAQALQSALTIYADRRAPFAWAVFPARLVKSSLPEDVPSFFAPAEEKGFRMATDFHTHTVMRRLRSEQTPTEKEPNSTKDAS